MNKELDILTNTGYMRRFWERVSDLEDSRQPMRDALKEVEEELANEHGVRRYSTYESFSASKSRNKDRGVRFRSV